MNRALPPDCAERYRTQELIGEGAYGEVYRAEQIGLERVVALKVLRAARSEEPIEVQRFLAEAKITSALSHPGIVIVIEWGHGAGLPWIAYEYLPGPSLMALSEREKLGPTRVAMAGAQIAQALQHAHERGVLHRDVKPENVVEVERDRYKIGDFGIAKWSGAGEVRTQTGMVIGSPVYLAPELIAGSAASPRSDVYALGISLYQLLAGRPPFDGSNVMEVLEGHVRGSAPPLSGVAPEAPPGLARVVERAMARAPEARYASAAELAQALEPWQGAVGAAPSAAARGGQSGGWRTAVASRPVRAVARPTSGRYGPAAPDAAPTVPLPRSRRLLVAAACAGTILAALAVTGWSRRQPPVHVESVPARVTTTASAGAPAATMRGSRNWLVREIDLLSSTKAVCVYVRYRSTVPVKLQVLDDKGGVKGLDTLPPGLRTFRREYGGLSPHREYRVIIDADDTGGSGIDLRVKTQISDGLGHFSPEVAAREGTEEALDAETQEAMRRFADRPGNSAVITTWFSIGQIFSRVLHLAEIERRLLTARAANQMIESHLDLDEAGVRAVGSYLRLQHDPNVLRTIDDQAARVNPGLRFALAEACLAVDYPRASSIAEAAFKSQEPPANDAKGPLLVATARQLPIGPDGAHAAARTVEAVSHSTRHELSEALVDLDPGAARQHFLEWVKLRPDLLPLGVAGLAELGEDTDVAALEGLTSGPQLVHFQRAVALRRLTDLATPAAQAAVARALKAAPGDPLALLCAARLGLPEGQAAAIQALEKGDVSARLNAAVALANLSAAAALPALTRALADPVREVKRNAAWAIGQIGSGPAPEALRAFALSDDDETGAGAWALGRLGDLSSGAALLAKLQQLRRAVPASPPWARAAVTGLALRLMKFAPAEPVLDEIAARSSKGLLSVCAARALPGAAPGTTIVTQFPFIGEQRTGVRVDRGQVVVARTTGSFGAGGEMKSAHDVVYSPAPYHSSIRSSIRLDFRSRQLYRSPREFVAGHAQEVIASTVPSNELDDHSRTAGCVAYGLAFIELQALPLPARR